jgi:hypothetical protein
MDSNRRYPAKETTLVGHRRSILGNSPSAKETGSFAAAVSEADSAMASLYAEALTVAPLPHSLRLDQRAWLGNIRAEAARSNTLLEAYNVRISELRRSAANWRTARHEIDSTEVGHSCFKPPEDVIGSAWTRDLSLSLEGYCRIEQAGPIDNAPGSALTYQLQNYTTADDVAAGKAIIVFAAAPAGKVIPLTWIANPGSTYGTPVIIANPGGPLLYLPGTTDGTLVQTDHALLAWRDGAWIDIDIDTWLASLFERLPQGLYANKGIYPNWTNGTASTDLWHDGDSVGGPTGGSADLRLRLDGDRLLLDSIALLKTQQRGSRELPYNGWESATVPGSAETGDSKIVVERVYGEDASWGSVHIVYGNRTNIIAPKEKDQAALSAPALAEDKQTVGWLANYDNICGQDYPCPLAIVIYKNGKVIRTIRSELMIWEWRFYRDGKQVTFSEGPTHGTETPSDYKLYDVSTGNLIQKIEGDGTHALDRHLPEWAKALYKSKT